MTGNANVTAVEALVLFYDWLIRVVNSSGTSRGFAEHGACSPKRNMAYSLEESLVRELML